MSVQTSSNFDLKQLLDERRSEKSTLFSEYVNPQLAKVLKTIGFDRSYVRGEGSYLWDKEGNKYLDFITIASSFKGWTCPPGQLECERACTGRPRTCK